MDEPTRHPAGHNHDHRSASRRSLSISLALILGYMVAEVIGGLVSGSLALLADAGHMLTDAAAIGLALLAIWLANRPASIERTFGFHRTEILAALLNALSLWLIAAWIFFEASRRFDEVPDVDGGLMLAVGAVGLLVNAVAVLVLKRSAGESLNVEGAFLHVMADLLGSVAVVSAGILVIALGWDVADPIFGIVIGVLILASSFRLLWKVLHVLMEGTPAHLDLHLLCHRLEELEGVTGVHDIHAWSITTGYDALSAHVTADAAVMGDPNPVLQRLRDIACTEFGIGHVTFQLEDSMDGCEEDHHIDHPEIYSSAHRRDG
ncbi:MAG: cation transporter [SAR202 cluster bacterium]|nr:cation transporter [Chloroflexota bacterium]MQG34476.1 cation transporter [SAR202 cluster bacterium]HCP23820.1 cation transporter [Dehalococcoidia bacterium]